METTPFHDIIETLGMQPHPEGGWYAETFRDPDTANGRARSTAIYYLLAEGQVSHWHRVDAVEVWHWYAGAPLALSISEDGRTARTLTLGSNLAAGQRPQGIVPTAAWQSARSTGGWSLVGCTVAPGFEFDGFELAPDGWAPGGAL
ncbi:cupin domain-containing protein [Maricaulis sp.]|uniref:cupin domain-containing protein n=1 Tax=Maricaulis sp. TaxID=1486257 RepID=UPI00260CC62E|nr:cupin domain-containing protein [Maricaulis sp.]